MNNDINRVDLAELLGQDLDKLPSMDDLLQETISFKEGDIVPGKVISVDKREVLVDIGYKSEGVVPRHEFRGDQGPAIGTELDVLIEALEDSEGRVILSKIKADKIRNWDNTVSKFEEGSIVDGRIVRKIKGGLIVDIGIEAFLPASQVDIRPIPNVEDLFTKTLKFKIVKINLKRKNVVVSRRELLEEERAKGREALLGTIKKGDIKKGIVKNITDFGVFIDLGGLDGLLHITDMSWGRINHPSEMLGMGDEVEVMILDIDMDKGRVSLGLKQKTDNPWTQIFEKYPVNQRVKGKVVNLTHYGAFIELEEGVEGLLHISEMSWTKRVSHPSEILNVGDEIEAVVLSINPDEQKLSLGLKQTQDNPWDHVEERFSENMRVKGIVRNLTDYGAFIEIADGIDGLVHISDMSWTKRVAHPSEMLKKGETIEAVVLSVDQENKKIALGIKQIEQDPWEAIAPNYQPGEEVDGAVSKVTKFGVFVTLSNGLEGLVHSSQLALDPGEKVEDHFKEGDAIKAFIASVDFEQRKISLTLLGDASEAAQKQSESAENGDAS